MSVPYVDTRLLVKLYTAEANGPQANAHWTWWVRRRSSPA